MFMLKQEGTDSISFNAKLSKVNIHPLITSSKKIERIAKQNVDSLEISIDCPFPEETFQIFAEMSNQGNPDFKVSNAFKVLCASDYFENFELKAKAMDFIRKKVSPQFTVKAFTDYLNQKWEFLSPFHEIFALDLPKYIKRSDFAALPVNHLIQIFHRPELTTLKPNEMTDFVLQHIKVHKVPDAVKMLDFVTLDSKSMTKIVSLLDNLGFKGHAYMIYSIMKMRDDIKEEKKVSQKHIIKKPFNGKYFSGVFTALKEYVHSENLLKDGTISFQSSSNNPLEVVNQNSRTMWNTANLPNSSITFILPNDSVTVTGYRIRSSDRYMPLGWRVEGSTDHGLTWYLIDEQKGCLAISEPDACEVFLIDASYKESFNVIKVTQIQKNTDGTNHFCIRHFDVFGTVYPSKEEYIYDSSIMFSSAALSTMAGRGKVLALSSSNSPHLMLEYARSDFWESNASDNSPYFIIDMKQRAIKPTGYTLRSPNAKQDTCQPVSWEFSAGNSLEAMQVLHKVKNSNDINGPCIFKYFALKTPAPQPCRYIMFKLKGANSGGKNQLFMDAFEVFGDLVTSLGEERCLQ